MRKNMANERTKEYSTDTKIFIPTHIKESFVAILAFQLLISPLNGIL
jgi:hypothetical protein